MDVFLRRRLPENAVVVEIPQAYHHVMLDQPLSLVTAVRTLLAGWHHGGWMPLNEPGTAR
jgi:pimeloyl-ACP methyl ester carboxylesterase